MAGFAFILAFLQGGSGAGARGRIWVLADGRPRAVEVRTGLTDGTATEISGPEVREGMEVIAGIQLPAAAAPAPKAVAPRMFF